MTSCSLSQNCRCFRGHTEHGVNSYDRNFFKVLPRHTESHRTKRRSEIFLCVYSIDFLSVLCDVSGNFANMSFRCGEKWILWRLDIFSFCCSPNTFRIVKTRTVWLVGHVASMGRKINNCNYSYSGWETWSNETTLQYGWEDNTEIDVMKYLWLFWTGFMRFRLEWGGGLLWTRQRIFGFCEQARNFFVIDEVLCTV